MQIKTVAIAFGLSALVGTTAGFADPATGDLTAGAAWSSRHGTIGSFGLELSDVVFDDVDVSAEYREGSQGHDARVKLRYQHRLDDTKLGQDTRLSFSVQHDASDWEKDSFKGVNTRLQVGVLAKARANLEWSAALFVQENQIKALRDNASPLLDDERRYSTTGGVKLGLGWGTIDSRLLPRQGQFLDVTVTDAFAGDRRFGSIEALAIVARSFSKDWSASLSVGAGKVTGHDGQKVSAHDRTYLGGRMPRGYAYGGIGPRDYVQGEVDTSLGGKSYSFASLEARRQVSDAVSLGVFLDGGSVWGLDGPLIGAMGPIDAHPGWASAAGFAAYWTTGMGTISLSVAKPLHHRDIDTLNRFSVGLLSAF